MRRLPILTELLTVLTLFACSAPDEPRLQTRELTPQEIELLATSDVFGLSLFREVALAEGDKNVFISPLSISMALGMTANGAAGSTLEAMRSTLGQSDMTEDAANQAYQSLIGFLPQADLKVQFDIANSIWYRQEWTFKETFYQQAQDYFSAEVAGLDFSDDAAADIINAWVKANTGDKIDSIIDPPIPKAAVMYLINALYFKGTWTYEFDPADTEDDEFNLLDGSTTPIKMMHLESDLLYYRGANFEMADLPYGDGAFSMTIILPNADVHVDSLVESLTLDNWLNWTSSLDTLGIALEMPKFKLDYKLGLKPALSTLGMGIAFLEGIADFSRMIEPAGLVYISKVLHKTFLQVDEEGTEAAAVTAVEVGITSIGEMPLTLRLDRPFLIAIRERSSGSILFAGKIVEPVWQD